MNQNNITSTRNSINKISLKVRGKKIMTKAERIAHLTNLGKEFLASKDPPYLRIKSQEILRTVSEGKYSPEQMEGLWLALKEFGGDMDRYIAALAAGDEGSQKQFTSKSIRGLISFAETSQE